MKRILVIGHSYVVDSNRRFWSEMGQSEDCQIDLVCPKSWKSNLIKDLDFLNNPDTDNGINALFPIDVYFKGNGSLYHYHWLSLYKVLLNKEYDSIFLFQETWAWSLAQVIFLKLLSLKNAKAKLFLAVCQNIIKPKLNFIIPFERLFCLFLQRIFFCTYEIEKVLDYKKINTKRSYLPFTFDSSIYQRRLKKPSEQLKIGFIGRISEEKGIETLMSSYNILKSRVSSELIMAGNGPLVSLIEKEKIQYLGVLSHRQAHEFYHKIDILILPSLTKKFWKEQFGRVLVEAVASGTCVIGSDSGAIPEVIGKIGIGKVFKEGNAHDLALKIEEMYLEMKTADYEVRMNKAMDNNESLFSHKSVAHNLFLEL